MTGVSIGELGSAMAACLVSAGINAVEAWPSAAKEVCEDVLVCVGVKSCVSASPGLGGYLGIRDGAELVGKRLEICFALDIYSPVDESFGVRACAETAEKLISVLPYAAGDSFRMTQLAVGDAAFDEASGMFLCRCEMNCRSYACAEVTGEGEFEDFVLAAAII